MKLVALRGVPWGRVNYFWDGCMPRDEQDWRWPWGTKRLHVVWQHGDCLYRSLCRSKPPECLIGHPDAFAFMQEDVYQQRWVEQWHALCALPQLFIAV